MLVGLCGPVASGKSTIASFLQNELGFTVISANTVITEILNGNGEDADAEGAHDIISSNLWGQCWRRNINIVLDDVLPISEAYKEFFKRPYFLPIYVTAPLMTRYQRLSRYREAVPSLSDFIRTDDLEMHFNNVQMERDTGSGPVAVGQSMLSWSEMERMCKVRILNHFSTLQDLHEHLFRLDLTNPERLRPGWDTYFMSLAVLASQRTNCMKRRVGCVIVRNHRIVATGYNGTPSQVTNCLDGGCSRCNVSTNKQGVGLDLCLCLHAEENAIIEAGRERCQGGTLYTNLFPCLLCAKVC